MQLIAPRRLIERDILHLEASMAGLQERYTRGETQQTIHVWWARRPHAAMRALTLFSLLREDSDVNIADAFSDLGVRRIRELLLSTYGRKPKVLDPFGGGGTIPFEAAYLGAEAYSTDSNALAAFIQAANLEFSDVLKQPGTLNLLRKSGEEVLKLVEKSTASLFPERKNNALCYVWSYTKRCQKCSRAFSASKRPWLSKKKGKTIFYQIAETGVEIRTEGEPAESHWLSRNGSAACPHCGEVQKISLNNTKDTLCCIISGKGRTGKTFMSPSEGACPSEAVLAAFERDVLRRLSAQLPSSAVPKWSGIINPGIYGMETHADHFNRRQRCSLLALIEAIGTIHHRIEQEHGFEVARFITCALSGLVDQVVDWNSRLSMWIPQNEQVGRGLCGPGIAMLWDYTETDPVGCGPSNLHSKLNRIVRGAEALADLPAKVDATLASAMDLPYEDGTFDAVITDPPYYDNIYYAPLADFIYPWKKMLLGNIVPKFFRTETTDGENELVSSSIRAGSSAKAHERYCRMFTKAIQEAARVLNQDGVFSLVYSHSSIKGWCALVDAFQRSAFTVQSAQPLAIERKERPRAMTSDAVNTCIVFVAHLNGHKESVTQEAALGLVKTELHQDYLTELKNLGWSDGDAGVALLARVLQPLCNVKSCGHDLESLVEAAGNLVSKLCPGFKLAKRRSL